MGSWSGHTSLQTESFGSDTGMLRLHWESHNDGASAAGRLKIAIHSAVSGRQLAVVVDHEGSGSDLAYVNEDPREFYLVVEAKQASWNMALEEGVRVTITKPIKD